jgi:hypothetical protein
MLLCVLVWIVGCDQFSTDYGNSKGLSGRKSLNGFGGLRRAYQNAGYSTRDVSRLTDRVQKSDVIVWTPQEYGSISDEVTDWFESWLSIGDRTLVYVVPDSGSEVDYWQDAMKLAPPNQRLEYRKQAARAINARANWRLNRSPLSSNGWFDVSPSVKQQPSTDLSGPWSAAESDAEAKPVSNSNMGFREERLLGSDQPVTTELKLTAYATSTPGAGAATGNVPAGFPAQRNAKANGPNSTGFSLFSASPTETEVAFESLLDNSDGDSVVAVIQSDQWNDSQIIVVAGGSLLTNFGLARPFGRQLAGRLIQASILSLDSVDASESLQAGFLTTGWSGVAVSERKPGVPTASGMELLTVWPISLITIHGVMLGLVVCLMLLPIFGRPRRLRRVEQGDFGDHLDAVAALMKKAGGEAYARQRISEYFRRIRDENAGPWGQPDTAEHASFTMKPTQMKPEKTIDTEPDK